MGIEIERKFLVVGDGWRQRVSGIFYRQGYLTVDPERTVRVRIAGSKGFLTIKGQSEGLSRSEFEYAIPLADATFLLDRLCLRPLVEKTRYTISYRGKLWEIDEFSGANSGLLLAEVELDSVDEPVEFPPWVGTEVSDDQRYYNASLAQNPFQNWSP